MLTWIQVIDKLYPCAHLWVTSVIVSLTNHLLHLRYFANGNEKVIWHKSTTLYKYKNPVSNRGFCKSHNFKISFQYFLCMLLNHLVKNVYFLNSEYIHNSINWRTMHSFTDFSALSCAWNGSIAMIIHTISLTFNNCMPSAISTYTYPRSWAQNLTYGSHSVHQ